MDGQNEAMLFCKVGGRVVAAVQQPFVYDFIL